MWQAEAYGSRAGARRVMAADRAAVAYPAGAQGAKSPEMFRPRLPAWHRLRLANGHRVARSAGRDVRLQLQRRHVLATTPGHWSEPDGPRQTGLETPSYRGQEGPPSDRSLDSRQRPRQARSTGTDRRYPSDSRAVRSTPPAPAQASWRQRRTTPPTSATSCVVVASCRESPADASNRARSWAAIVGSSSVRSRGSTASRGCEFAKNAMETCTSRFWNWAAA